MRYEDFVKQFLLGLFLAMAFLTLMLLQGCRTKYVSVPEYHKEYINRTDSFFHTDTIKEKEWMTIREVDSTQLAELGIQLRNIKNAYLIEWNRNRERNNTTLKAKVDTIIKTDSIDIPYPVERKLNRWESLKMEVGGWAIGVLSVVVIASIVFIVVWLRKKFG